MFAIRFRQAPDGTDCPRTRPWRQIVLRPGRRREPQV